MYRWRSFCSVSMIVALLLIAAAPRTAATFEPTVTTHMDVSIGLQTAYSGSRQTVSIHDYSIINQTVNRTKIVNNQTVNYTANISTLIQSPGPVVVSLVASNGSIIPIGGVFQLVNGSTFITFTVSIAIGFDVVTVRVFDQALNRTSVVTFNSALSSTDQWNEFNRRWNALNSSVQATEAQRSADDNFKVSVELAVIAALGAGLILLSQHRMARALRQKSWVDRAKSFIKTTFYVDPTAYIFGKKGWTPDLPAEDEIEMLEQDTYALKSALNDDLNMIERIHTNEKRKQQLEQFVTRARESSGLSTEEPLREAPILRIGGQATRAAIQEAVDAKRALQEPRQPLALKGGKR